MNEYNYIYNIYVAYSVYFDNLVTSMQSRYVRTHLSGPPPPPYAPVRKIPIPTDPPPPSVRT